MDELSFVIPGPIVPWARPRPKRGGGGFVNPARYAAYKKHVKACGASAVLEFRSRQKREWDVQGHYNLELHFFFQDFLVRDDDNCEKAIKDGLIWVVWGDDNWTRFGRILKDFDLDRSNPRVEVTAWLIL